MTRTKSATTAKTTASRKPAAAAKTTPPVKAAPAGKAAAKPDPAMVSLTGHHGIELHLPFGGCARIDERRRRVAQHFEHLQARAGRQHPFAVSRKQVLPLQALDDLGARGRSADALGLFQPLARRRVFHEAPGVLHGVDQRALVVAWRSLRALGVDAWFGEPGHFAIGKRRQRLLSVIAGSVRLAGAVDRFPALHQRDAAHRPEFGVPGRRRHGQGRRVICDPPSD